MRLSKGEGWYIEQVFPPFPARFLWMKSLEL